MAHQEELLMRTDEKYARYNRDHLRYPSDVTDEEWGLIEPLIPPAKKGGGQRRVHMREVVSGLMYVLSTGSPWWRGSERLAAEKPVV